MQIIIALLLHSVGLLKKLQKAFQTLKGTKYLL